MVELKLDVPKEFYKEETRCNYEISAKMKEVWSVELDMLVEFQRVCKKYGLSYFADSGTLIGAVRHKGYIPWDDDIDIVMMRADYEKLLEVAKQEFQYPLFLQTTYSDTGYIRGHAQLRNSETTGAIADDIGRGFNLGIFIDIFPMDILPDNKIHQRLHIKYINTIWKVLYHGSGYCKKTNYSFLKSIGNGICKLIVEKVGEKSFFSYYERVCSKYRNKNYQTISYVAYSRGKNKHLWKRDWFASSKQVPFEFINITIPTGYDKRLKKQYGDYMEIQHAPTAHGEVMFNTDVSYSKYLKTNKCKYSIIKKPENISYEEITELLHNAHQVNVKKGINMLSANQTAEDTKKRL